MISSLIGVTSVITLVEVLVQPLRHHAVDLQRQYRDLLRHSRNMQVVPIDPAVAEQAADLRSRHNLRTPDALQVAAALAAGCDAFLTNDLTLKRIVELPVLVLDELTA